MIDTFSSDSASSVTTTTVPDWDKLPCVQYGFLDDQGPARTPKLRTIFEPIPEDATTASPIYILSRKQYERQERLESGYEVKGPTSIAKELQDECEAADSVLYPVHIESDVYHEEGPAALIDWFRVFVEDYLDVPFQTCRLFFSGNRSIHVHVPRFVSGEPDRERLKKVAESFCEDRGAKLDCGLYYTKQLFRLPGVEHAKTGLPKVEIGPEWDHTRIFREVNLADSDVPESYESVLRGVFLQPQLMKDRAQPTAYTPHDLFRILDSEKTVLEFEPDEREIETPLVEQEMYPDDAVDAIRWLQYNAKEFSPYALASGNGRSVAVVKVKGTPFCREEVTIGNYNRPVHALIPAYFYGARGCAGAEFTKDHEHAPLQLSKPDYEKWNYEDGDHVVIIGGKSNNSRILSLNSCIATVAGHALTGKGASRQAALDYLESKGYDVGKAGIGGKSTPSKRKRMQRDGAHPRSGGKTEAARLQRQAERDGINTLDFREVSNVVNRLLRIGGWLLAWEWVEEQYSEQFHPEKTWTRMKGIIEYYDDLNVEVPSKPR